MVNKLMLYLFSLPLREHKHSLIRTSKASKRIRADCTTIFQKHSLLIVSLLVFFAFSSTNKTSPLNVNITISWNCTYYHGPSIWPNKYWEDAFLTTVIAWTLLFFNFFLRLKKFYVSPRLFAITSFCCTCHPHLQSYKSNKLQYHS